MSNLLDTLSAQRVGEWLREAGDEGVENECQHEFAGKPKKHEPAYSNSKTNRSGNYYGACFSIFTNRPLQRFAQKA